MTGGQVDTGSLSVAVRNVGGIDELSVDLQPGVIVLVGRNATNRTSLLRAIAAALGGSAGELKRTADAGDVRLEVDGETYARRFERRGDDVAVDGEPWTRETATVDAFACLLESNPARRAVARADGAALREAILAPVDTEELSREIDSTRAELASIDRRIDEIDRAGPDLAALEARRQRRADELAAVEEELSAVRAALEEAEADPETDAPEDEALEDGVLEELRSTREDLERVRDERETEAAAVASLEDELAAVERELEDLDVPETATEDLEAELQRLQRRERECSATVASLESIVELNEELLSGDASPPGADASLVAGEDPLADAQTDPLAALDPGSRERACWTCGTEVEQAEIEARLEDLRDVVDEYRARREELRERVESVRSDLADRRERGDRLDELEGRREGLVDELERRRERVAELEERAAELHARVEALEERADDADDGAVAAVVQEYERLTELEYERGQLEEDLQRLDDDVATAREREAERDRLERLREQVSEELRDLRDRVASIESTAVETFNEHAEAVLDRLGYANVERVWLERTFDDADDATAASGRPGDGTENSIDGSGAADRFQVHVARADDDGTVHEDTLDHLSESEREVLGLVLALTGFLVHDVYEVVPVVLLDSLEAIDAERIAELVAYVAEYAPYLVVALLPEDAQALPDAYDRVRVGEE